MASDTNVLKRCLITLRDAHLSCYLGLLPVAEGPMPNARY